MSTNTRRELQELRTLYLLNPQFRDVVVEGRDDAAWIRWYLAQHGCRQVRVFAVDDRVTVPASVVSRVHRDVNARGRVVALSAEFEEWGVGQPSLTCIVDADFDLFEGPPTPAGLLKTDYAAMEVYGITRRPLSKFLVASAKSDISAEQLVSVLRPAWTVLYSLRYVLHRHGEGRALTDRFANRCINDAGQIVVDARELLAMTRPSPTRDVLDELLSAHEEHLSRIPPDSLQGIRGHDIAPLIIRFLRLKNSMARPDHLEQLLRQSIELCDLDEFQLFRSLLGRVS